MTIIGFLPMLIFIIIIIGIVLAVRQKNDSGGGEETASIARHIWIYLITFVFLGIFAAGIGQLLTLLFDITIKASYLTQVGRDAFNLQLLSLGLAMTVIGGPLWFLFWRSVQRRAGGNRVETGAVIRKLFLNFVMLLTGLMALAGAAELLTWLMGGAPLQRFSSSSLAVLIITVLIWVYHLRVSEGEGHPSAPAQTTRRWYVYFLSGFGLVWLASGLVQIINAAVTSIPAQGDVLVEGHFFNEGTRAAVSQVLLGGVAWYFHWFRMARDDAGSTLRQVYFYVFTITGGAITALVSATVIFYHVLEWLFGGTQAGAWEHFQFLGWAVPAALVGVAIWGYHSSLAREEAGEVGERRGTAQRTHYYLMSFLGLGTAVAGLITLFGLLLELIINALSAPLAVSPGWWTGQAALCLSLLLVGVPLWLYYWNGVIQRVKSGGASEWRAASRRIFLYVVIGASIITVAAGSVNIIYQLLNGLLVDGFGIDVLRNSKWSLQTLFVAGALLWYHWQVMRADQKRGAEKQITRRRVTLLTDDPGRELADRLEDKLGYKVKVLKREGGQGPAFQMLSDEEIERLAGEVAASPGNNVLLVVTGEETRVIGYREA